MYYVIYFNVLGIRASRLVCVFGVSMGPTMYVLFSFGAQILWLPPFANTPLIFAPGGFKDLGFL